MRFLVVALLSLLLSFVCVVRSSSVSVSIDATNELHATSPLLYGIFFEEINHAGQGGLYSQLIDNTNFEWVDYWPWFSLNNSTGMHLSLSNDNPLNIKNRQHLKISFDSSINNQDGSIAIANPGFHGMTFTAGANYKFSMHGYVLAEQLQNPSLTITLEDSNGNVVAKNQWGGIGLKSWKRTEFILTPSANVTNGRLSIYFDSSLTQPGISIHLDMISLMPQQGWNGLSFIREDLGQMIADLSPAFVRFPGGCYVEGDTLDHRFNWKESIGDLIERPGHYDLWNYFSEDGLGFLEYLLFIEKLSNAQGKRVEPVWVVNNGVAHANSVPTSNLYQWIQDALDSLEFAMGDVNTKYGAMRAALGHPEPFQINIMAIGNEDCNKPYYTENYKAFYNAIKAKYPNMTCIANCDLTKEGAVNELWDFHVYQDTTWFFNNIHQWDSYDRSAAKVFESEYAVTRGCGAGNLNAAIAEAAYMTGLERNSDVVSLASYAPLLVNTNDRTWMPDAIVFDSYRAYGTPSYWIQNMFANAQKGTVPNSQYVLSTSISGGKVAVSSTIADDAYNPNQQILIIKAVNYDTSNGAIINFSVTLPSGKSMQSPATIQSLYGGSVNDENSFDMPTNVTPVNSQQNINDPADGKFTVAAPQYSAHIIRVTLA